MDWKKTLFWVFTLISGILLYLSLLKGGTSPGIVGGIMLLGLLIIHVFKKVAFWIELTLFGAIWLNLVGWYLDLYDKVWLFDEVAHFITPFSLILLIGSFLLPFKAIKSKKYQFLFLSAIGISIGVLWEIYEWFLDMIVPRQVIGDLDDTITDLILDSLAAVGGSILILFRKKDIPGSNQKV